MDQKNSGKRFSIHSIKRKYIFIAVAVVLCIDIVYLGSSFYQSHIRPRYARLSDQEKIKKVFLLYREYKEASFAGADDILAHNVFHFFPSQGVLFVDVRTKQEQEISMIPYAVSRDEFEKNIEKYKGIVIVAYCTIGKRSGSYVLALKEKGFQAFNLTGGILAWIHNGRKLYCHGKEVKRVHVYGPQWNLAPSDYKALW